MIVLVVVAVLAAVAIPAFLHYQLKSKTAEASVNLGSIATMQSAFFSEWEGYLFCGATGSFPLGASKMPWPGPAPGFDQIGFTPMGDVYYSYEVAVGGGQAILNIANLGIPGRSGAFAASAVADLDGDGVHGEFIYSSNVELVSRTRQLGAGHAASRSTMVEDLTPGRF